MVFLWFLGFTNREGFIGIWRHTLQPPCTPCIKPLKMVPHWNKFDDDFMFSMFWFVNKYLEPNGCMVLFHEDSPRITKNIMSFLKNNNFKILWHWSIIHNLQHSNIKFTSMKVIYSTNFNCLIFFSPFFNNNSLLCYRLHSIKQLYLFMTTRNSNSNLKSMLKRDYNLAMMTSM